MKITTYTCLTGDRDTFAGGLDRAFLESDGTAPRLFATPLMNAKGPKVLSHQYLPEVEASLWMDANIRLKVPAAELARFLVDADLALFRHPERVCVYDEMFASIADPRYDETALRSQMAHYQRRNWPERAGLFECGVIFRRHTADVARINERWWAEICRWSPQDQLSFPIAAAGSRVNIIPGSIRDNRNDFFEYRRHGE